MTFRAVPGADSAGVTKPMAIGALSDFMQAHVVAFGLSDPAHAAGQGLRYALCCGVLVNLWAATHYLIGSTKLKKDWVG